MTIFCDPNIISELARPRPNPGVIAWSQNIESIAISVITVEEIIYGLAAKPNPRIQAWFDRFLSTYCSVLAITVAIAKEADRSSMTKSVTKGGNFLRCSGVKASHQFKQSI